MTVKLGSLFDGSGGFPLAGVINGMVPTWASEIESYPLRVTEQRFPNMRQLGDVMNINGAEIEPVDVITFGSPCQDLSVAGKQKGIHEGDRSNLFFEAVRIIKEMRSNDEAIGWTDVDVRPRYAVWENVPGAFSSNKGQDFRAVLQALADVKDSTVHVPGPASGKWKPAGCVVGDGWSIAWRVYDAQYWGVPQRRKRIYIIADFASERAGEILFEREGLCWDPEKSGEAREGASSDVTRGIDAAGFKAGNGAKARTIGYQREVSPSLTASPSGTNQVPTTVYCLQGNGIDRALTAGCNGKGWRENECYTLNTIDRPAVVFGKEMYNSGEGCTGGHYVSEDGPAPTLRSSAHPPGAAYPLNTDQCAYGIDCRNATEYAEINGTLQAKSNGGTSLNYNNVIRTRYVVRRLTPLECCRLQGFPDWWEDGVDGSDSARYKMWGNGIALPCAVDVLSRIAKAIPTS